MCFQECHLVSSFTQPTILYMLETCRNTDYTLHTASVLMELSMLGPVCVLVSHCDMKLARSLNINLLAMYMYIKQEVLM